MKKLLAAMFVALLIVGCGEDDLGEDIPESNQTSAATPPESNASSVETPPAKTSEVAKVVVDGDQIEFRGGIIEQDGLAYFEGKPFTGVAVWKYTAPNPNGQKRNEITYKDGKRHGLETYYWHVSGQKESERTYKDHKEHGPGTAWYENGQKKEEWNFKDRKQHGPYTKWYENGQKKEETTYKDSKLVTSIIWKPNGEKCPDTNVVNGTGIVFWYHENGQKMHELSFKRGFCISVKEWDEDGNLLE